ncbi:MAG: DNA replication/repair protein RecF [Oscillospiraceae bacterium]|nr:DNA replication/repair protein RecF [Oscillospiraceae bacterium]
MIIKNILTENFRNLETGTVEFSPGVNIIYGDNAQGKTNLAEAINFFASGKSFRSAKASEIIKYGENGASLSAEISEEKHNRNDSIRDSVIKIKLSKKSPREFYRNGIKLEKYSEFFGTFRVVLFTPSHLSIIKDGPMERRSFIDGAISQIKPAYASLLNDYTRKTDQRTALIRTIAGAACAADRRRAEDTLETWNDAVAKSGAKIFLSRHEYISRLAPEAEKMYDEISGGAERLGILYKSDLSFSENDEGKCENGVPPDEAETVKKYLKLLQASKESDIRLCATSRGAHRDELVMTLNSKNTRVFASQGQQRSCVLALKLAEGEVSKRFSGGNPVYILDDVLSELDAKRQKFVTERLDKGQVIITACDCTTLNSFEGRIFNVTGGKIERIRK